MQTCMREMGKHCMFCNVFRGFVKFFDVLSLIALTNVNVFMGYGDGDEETLFTTSEKLINLHIFLLIFYWICNEKCSPFQKTCCLRSLKT